MSNLTIAIVVGSLRQESYNKRLAKALVKQLPANLEYEFVDIGQLPLYNQDNDGNDPDAVSLFKQQIKDKDGVIFVTPEYNRSVPGVLKNALDHGSRPYGQSVWAKKVAGVIGTSPSPIGSALAQQHLRNILALLDMPTLNQPEAFIQWTDDMINPDGSFVERTRNFVQAWLDAYIALLITFKK